MTPSKYDGDERRNSPFCPVHEKMAEMPEKVARIEACLENIKKNAEETSNLIKGIKGEFLMLFVSKEAFNPVKLIVYGMMSIIGVTVLGAILARVIIR